MSNTEMRALQLTRPDTSLSPHLALLTTSVPAPKSDHALVKIHASAIHPSDRANAKGGLPLTTFPRIPGRDFSGTISNCPDRPELVGTEVFGTGGAELALTVNGAHAEYAVLPLRMLVPKPKALSFVQAASVGVPYSTALLCLRKVQPKPNESVLVLGAAGAVGSAAVQIAKAMGPEKVFAAYRSTDADVNLANDAGLSAISLITQGRGADIVIDTIGSVDLMDAGIRALASGGRFVWISSPREGSPVLGLDLLMGYRKEINLIGCNSLVHGGEELVEDMRQLAEWFESGQLKAKEENAIEVVGMEEAIEKGYNAQTKKPVVIIM